MLFKLKTNLKSTSSLHGSADVTVQQREQPSFSLSLPEQVKAVLTAGKVRCTERAKAVFTAGNQRERERAQTGAHSRL